MRKHLKEEIVDKDCAVTFAVEPDLLLSTYCRLVTAVYLLLTTYKLLLTTYYLLLATTQEVNVKTFDKADKQLLQIIADNIYPLWLKKHKAKQERKVCTTHTPPRGRMWRVDVTDN